MFCSSALLQKQRNCLDIMHGMWYAYLEVLKCFKLFGPSWFKKSIRYQFRIRAISTHDTASQGKAECIPSRDKFLTQTQKNDYSKGKKIGLYAGLKFQLFESMASFQRRYDTKEQSSSKDLNKMKEQRIGSVSMIVNCRRAAVSVPLSLANALQVDIVGKVNFGRYNITY